MRNLADDPIFTAPGSDTQFHALGVMMALKKSFLHDLSNSGSAFDYMVKAGPKTRSKNVTEN
jgi:hypothetical protein